MLGVSLTQHSKNSLVNEPQTNDNTDNDAAAAAAAAAHMDRVLSNVRAQWIGLATSAALLEEYVVFVDLFFNIHLFNI